jgi:putative aldouronate transport system permease protein
MSKIKESVGYKVFKSFNYTFLLLIAVACLIPLINVLAISFSDKISIASGEVKLWPKGFNTVAYEYMLNNKAFWVSMGVSFKRIILGGVVNMLLCIMVAYPLSKDSTVFWGRKFYAWYIIFTMLFSGGLIPGFLVVKYTGLMDTIWALIIPGAVPVFNVILLLNFFRQLPKEIAESAYIDGAGEWTTLWKIYLPLSKAALATICLFTLVGHWNSWFDGLIFMNRTEHYPMQSYMQTVIVSQDFKVTSTQQAEVLQKLDNQALISAQIFIGMVPILCVYPFLQKYFTQGIVLGSVKG